MVGRRGRFQGTFFSQVGARREKEIEQGGRERGKEERETRKRERTTEEEDEL